MRTGSIGLGAASICALGICLGAAAAAAPPQPAPDIDGLISRVGERVAEMYRRAQKVICLERSTVQPIRANWSIDGMARTVESELRVELSGTDPGQVLDAKIVREVRRINGREPRGRDLKDRSGCTDPNPLSPEPLEFLLPAHRSDYEFRSMRRDREFDRDALSIAFRTTNRRSRAELIRDERGHDDCFDWTGPIARSGRVWVDAVTYDVLKVESHLEGPVDIRVPDRLQREYNFAPWVVLDRDDLTLHYRPVPFHDPEEVLLLPDRIESLTVLRSDLQSIRRTDLFSDYRRFLIEGHVKRGR
jgi:hypothetical protein